IGASQPQSIFGTQTNAFMTRATEICAVVFIITSVTLGIMSSKGSRSLVSGRRAPMARPAVAGKIPALPPTQAAQAPAQAPAAAAAAVAETVKTTAEVTPPAQPAPPAENVAQNVAAASK
ncbi:MAG: preprotein translocase subunit SecG, partial [Candidatus Omnitrophota bacterium]